MLTRRRTITAAMAAALGAPFASAALAHGEADLPDEAVGLEAGRDRFDRLTVEVRVGEAGPFDFVVDSGADRSVLSDDLAAKLGLEAGAPVMVHGITGAELMPTVRSPPLRLGRMTLKGRDFPVLPRERLGADGLVGVDALSGRRLVMDFERRRLLIQPSSSDLDPIAARGEAYVAARRSFGMLTVVQARASGVAINAYIDSGAGVTIANRALASAIQARGRWRDPAPLTSLYGVTSHEAAGEVRVLDRLDLGVLAFDTVPMIVSDLHLFDRWGLRDEPTLLLGANVLRLFSRVELDYRRRVILFRSDVEAGPLLA